MEKKKSEALLERFSLYKEENYFVRTTKGFLRKLVEVFERRKLSGSKALLLCLSYYDIPLEACTVMDYFQYS